MKYKITRLYLKTKDELIAAFININDVYIFITQKFSHDEKNKTNVLYRVYDDLELVHEFSNGLARTLTEPEDTEHFSNAKFSFKVVVQSANTLERTTVACFNNKDDAHLFVTGKCSSDDLSVSSETFMIFKNDILISTLNKNIIDNNTLKDLISSKVETGATLSPLVTKPVPPGGPGNYWNEREEEDQ